MSVTPGSPRSRLLRVVDPDEALVDRADPVDAATLAEAAIIVDAVRREGTRAVERYTKRFGEIDDDDSSLIIERDDLDAALRSISNDDREVLERAADRIRSFAEAQLACLHPLDIDVPGGRAGHVLRPVARAGLYAPGGRYPLLSSTLMTVIPARVAGVREVTVATPRPNAITLAAAAIAGADRVLRVGGAHAIASLAYGLDSIVDGCDVIAGPGNRWVTAAKKLVFGRVGIDGLAGPSELLIIADRTADPRLVALDLLAQAEHDPDARPMLVTTDAPLIEAVEAELDRQLADLPTAAVAREALERNGFAARVESLDEAIALSDRIAPEHLEVMVEPALLSWVFERASNFGAIFLGPMSAEAFGDYGAGPNHTLPTAGAARYASGLSVLNFLRTPTWLRLESAAPLMSATKRLAALEGLAAHGRSAALRSSIDQADRPPAT